MMPPPVGTQSSPGGESPMPTGPAPTQPAITSGTEGSPVASGTPVASTTSLLEANSAVKRDTGLGAAFVAFVVAAIL